MLQIQTIVSQPFEENTYIVWQPPRSDGLVWQRTDFEDDGVHPSQNGESKAGSMLIDFFKSSLYTRCWFVANQYCL